MQRSRKLLAKRWRNECGYTTFVSMPYFSANFFSKPRKGFFLQGLRNVDTAELAAFGVQVEIAELNVFHLDLDQLAHPRSRGSKKADHKVPEQFAVLFQTLLEVQVMAKFHAEWSDRLCNVILPYLQTDDSKKSRLAEIASILREWTVDQKAVYDNVAKCNRTYTRFTTDSMSEILPDILNAPSGWNTDNHYFYEIVNRTGTSIYIQLAISSRNITDDFRVICDRINKIYPTKFDKENWQYRTPFKTKSVLLGEDLSKAKIFAGLNECLDEIQAFEADLKQKLGV